MSKVGGKGPHAMVMDEIFLTQLPRGGASRDLLHDAMHLWLYRALARGVCTHEVYVNGPIFEVVEEGIAAWLDRRAKALVIEVFLDMTERGVIQSRGPETWAIQYMGFGFKTIPGVLPQREAILERDEWKCRYCWEPLTGDANTHLDHVYPRSRGGWDDAANVVAVCRACNISKGARTIREWRATGNQNAWLR